MKTYALNVVFQSVPDKDVTCSMLYPSASSEGNWKDEDLKTWGKMARR